MALVMEILFALFFVILPAAILWLIQHQSWAQKMGAIILCYGTGLLLGNLGLIPQSVAPIQNTLSEVTIALALPMLLFTLNVKQWSQVAGKAMLSMVLATTSVVALSSSLYFYFIGLGEPVEATSHLAAMSVGVYTGGTPNLAAIKAGLDINVDQYLLFHSFDVLLGASYMLIMVTVAIPFFRLILKKPAHLTFETNQHSHQYEDDNYLPLLQKENWPQVGKVIGLSILTLALSLGLTEVATAVFQLSNSGALVIIFLTSFGIGFSLFKKVQALHLAYKMGMYLIYIFCITVASMANLKELLNFDPMVAIFLFGTVIGSILLHALFCRLTNVDSDTFMATSVSAICSPPFVPMIAKALGNSNVILSGMTTGIIGYALGNYIGISLALLLQKLA